MEPRERQQGAEEETGFLISLQITAASSELGSFKCLDCYLIEFLTSLAWIEFWGLISREAGHEVVRAIFSIL